MTDKEKIWEELFNIFSTHAEERELEGGEYKFVISDDSREEFINELTGYIWERLGNEPEEDNEISLIDRLDIEHSPNRVWAEKVQAELEKVTNDDVSVYNELGEPDGDVYDDGFTHATRNGVRFVTWYGETAGEKTIDRYTKAWARKVDKAIARVS